MRVILVRATSTLLDDALASSRLVHYFRVEVHTSSLKWKRRDMANKEQQKRKAKTNAPKLTQKQKKEKKARKALEDRNK